MRFLEKSRSLAVDSIAYDLEDSVTINKKPEARANILTILNRDRAPSIREQAVRINSVSSGFALQDLTAVLQAKHLDALVVPKVDRQALPERHAPGSTNPVKIIALIESARAITDLKEICAASPYVSGLTFAAEDFALDLSITRTPDLHEFTYARSAIVSAARAFGIPSALDLVSTTFRGEEGTNALRRESENGRRFGFNGKQCIHPDQVGLVQDVFGPGEEEVVWAVRVLVADRKADEQGRGAWTLDGKMIDVPVVGKARAIVAKAEVCGFDVEGLWEKHGGEEPQ
jgi:citrate lyase subunit beta-like protein